MSEKATLDDFKEAGKTGSTNLELGPIELDLPVDWESSELSELFNLISGNNYSGDNLSDDDNGGRIFLTLKSVNKGGGFNWDSLKYYSGEVNEREIVEPGELLIANTDVTQNGDIVGYSTRVPDFDSAKEIAASMDLSILRPTSDLVNLAYTEYLLQTDYIHSRMRAFSAGSTVLHLNTDLAKGLSIPHPPLPEQRKIATVLYTIDQAIEKTKETIERLNRIQRGTLRDLFENGIEKEAEYQDSPMGRFPKHWEIKPMEKVGLLINGNAFPKEYQGLSEGKYPFIKVSDTNDYRRYVNGSKNYISEETAEELGCNIQPEGTVILPKRGAAIMTNKRRILAQDSAIDNNQIGIVGEEVQPLFLYYYLSDVDMGRFVQEGAVKSLTKSLLSKVRVPVPSPETQSKIVETLESIDERIEAEKQIKSQQERLKRGLMQDLLSGTVRTTDTNIEVPDEISQHG